MKNKKIDFIPYHKPVLQTGEYKIEIQHQIDHAKINQQKLSFLKTFYIAGERFHLNQNNVNSVFPPNCSVGEHSNLLSHIVLNRSTLPWERNCSDSDEQWLLLLLFTNEEIQKSGDNGIKTQIKKLRELRKSDHFKNIQLQSGQDDDNQVSIIEVKKSLLKQFLPTRNDLKYLAHVRKVKSAEHALQEQAIILGNRITEAGKSYNAYLVSIEDRYTGNNFNFRNAKDSDPIPLIVLKNWNFDCSKRYKITKKSLQAATSISQEDKEKLEKELLWQEFFTKKSLQVALNKVLPGVDINTEIFAFGEFGKILKHLNLKTLSIDSSNTTTHKQTKKYLDAGFTPMPHFFRNGERSVSWYHGPLIPSENKKSFKNYMSESFGNTASRVRSSDQLTRYYTEDAMFDIGYSAAWELGRLLLLKNKRASRELYQWKRNSTQQLKNYKQYARHSHILGSELNNKTNDLPKIVAKWFDDLKLLKCLPFNYLLPDEKILPTESINFFWVDTLWVECLINGALSVVGINDKDSISQESSNDKNIITGCLLRSEVVSGWPDIIIEAYSKDGTKLESLRIEKLSDSILICMFAGKIQNIEIHLKPEALHSEFVKTNDKYFIKNKPNNEVIMRSSDKKIVNFEKSFLSQSPSETALDLLTTTKKYKFSLNN